MKPMPIRYVRDMDAAQRFYEALGLTHSFTSRPPKHGGPPVWTELASATGWPRYCERSTILIARIRSSPPRCTSPSDPGTRYKHGMSGEQVPGPAGDSAAGAGRRDLDQRGAARSESGFGVGRQGQHQTVLATALLTAMGLAGHLPRPGSFIQLVAPVAIVDAARIEHVQVIPVPAEQDQDCRVQVA